MVSWEERTQGHQALKGFPQHHTHSISWNHATVLWDIEPLREDR